MGKDDYGLGKTLGLIAVLVAALSALLLGSGRAGSSISFGLLDNVPVVGDTTNMWPTVLVVVAGVALIIIALVLSLRGSKRKGRSGGKHSGQH
jgi:ABC-type Na+ efflux pump permease subunit